MTGHRTLSPEAQALAARLAARWDDLGRQVADVGAEPEIGLEILRRTGFPTSRQVKEAL